MSAGDACLQFDVGNSSAKWRLVRDGRVACRGQYQPADASAWVALARAVGRPAQVWISSVASPAAEAALEQKVLAEWGLQPWFARTRERSGELRNSYQDPTRMGVDRWLAMLAARHLWPGGLCVVDAGSALTIDLVSAAGQHEGGYIIPGPALMERALLLDTDRVRFAEEVDYQLSPGLSTAEAVRHGIALAQAGAVAMAVDNAGPGSRRLVITGGAGETLMRLLAREADYLADLVFQGLELMAASEA